MTNDKDILITNDMDLVKNIIFNGTQEEAIKICKFLRQHDLNIGWAGFGLYLSETLGKDIPLERIREVTKLNDKLHCMEKQFPSSLSKLLVLQEVMKYVAGKASDEFKAKVEK